MARNSGFIRIVFTFFLTFSQSVIGADAPRVLLINSYHIQYSWTQQLVEGVTSELLSLVPEENIHVEFMDSRRFIDDPEYHELKKSLFQYKYNEFPLDVVLASDDAAFYFLMENGDELFPGLPLGFMGVNVFNPDSVVGKDNVFGIKEGMAIKANLELILKLQPSVKKVVLLADKTELGRRMVSRANDVLSELNTEPVVGGPEFEIWDDFHFSELHQRVLNLPSDSAVLMLAIHKDSGGQYFSYARDLPKLANESPVPVYGMWGGGLMLGRGIVGGAINDPKQQGTLLASMAKRVLNGTSPQSIGILPSSEFSPRFDYKNMERFGLSLENVPEGSEIINHNPSYFEEHREVILYSSYVIAAMTLVIAILLINIRRRIHAEKNLKALKLALEDKVKEQTEILRARNIKLEELSSSMARLAHTDSLTESPNRRAINDILDDILFLEGENRQKTVAIALVDVDDFKAINDKHGHGVGDSVLKVIAKTMESHLRPQDLLGRWGGEEFLVVLQGVDSIAALSPCERIRRAVESIDSLDFKITISIGVADTGEASNKEELIILADKRLYRAKQNGKNQVCL
ncbi:diguanylate cyclase [Vibrio sp. HN007]|uniref:diguanylate cyclase n=1 Tax=Vibrio iocasae TaxID=3098914 RepID=UPI0035D417C2